MSRQERNKIIADVGLAMRVNQNASDIIDELVCEELGICRTDLRCLDVVEREGPIPAGRLAEATGLTTGAVTALLDRMEQAGYVHRVRDEQDRRRVLAELTPLARDLCIRIYGPLSERWPQLAKRYTVDELALIRDYLQQGAEFLRQYASELRAAREANRAGPGPLPAAVASKPEPQSAQGRNA